MLNETQKEVLADTFPLILRFSKKKISASQIKNLTSWLKKNNGSPIPANILVDNPEYIKTLVDLYNEDRSNKLVQDVLALGGDFVSGDIRGEVDDYIASILKPRTVLIPMKSVQPTRPGASYEVEVGPAIVRNSDEQFTLFNDFDNPETLERIMREMRMFSFSPVPIPHTDSHHHIGTMVKKS